jgi:hypothetical protein
MALLTEAQKRELLRRGGIHLPVALEARVDPPELTKELTQLRALIRKHGREAIPVKLRVTVNMAKAMKFLMGKNRKLQEPWVLRWVRTLQQDRWRALPTQGMSFDWDGLFRDGQHRAEAIIRSGIEADVWVAFGEDPESFPYYDTGLRRNAAQNVALDGIRYANPVTYVVRLKYRTEHEGEMPDDGFVHDEAVRLMTEDDVMERAIIVGRKVQHEHHGATLSSVALAYWLIAQRSRRNLSIDEFFKAFYGEGAGLAEDSPIHRLRRKFRAFLKLGRKAQQYLNQTQQAAWIILAWNAWIHGQSIPTHGPGSRWPHWAHKHALPVIDERE